MRAAALKPPWPYYGGKTALASRIVELLPEHKVYCEPYAGSGAVLFAKLRSHTEVLNDTNSALVNAFRVMQDQRAARELWRRILHTPYSRAEFERAADALTLWEKGLASRLHAGDPRFMLRGVVTRGQIEAAWAWFVQCCMSLGSQPGNEFSIHRATAGSGKDRQWGRKDIRRQCARLRGVVVEDLRAIDCLRTWDSPDTVFYVDPPYVGANQGHYSGFTDEDFLVLVGTLSGIRGRFVLSNYDHPEVPSDWERHEIEVSIQVPVKRGKPAGRSRSEKRLEVLWVGQGDGSGRVAELAQQELFA